MTSPARRARAAAALAIAAWAAPASAAAERVRPEALVSADAVPPGGAFQIAVRLSIDPGWHVQSNRPSEETFIKTRLEVAPADGLLPGPVRYPEGKLLEAPALGGRLSVYDDGVVFGADVQVAAGAAPGDRRLTGKLTYQACNDTTCLFPKTVDLEFPVRVDPAAGPPRSAGAFAALPAAGVPAAPAASEIDRGIAARGFPLWLAGVFVLGLGLNLTPCVYPVIAVTISFFGRQGGGVGAQVLRAVAYAAGIGLTFMALFLLAGLGGRMFGAWLQSPWVLAALALVLVALGLSNFGLFELQAPAAIRNRLGGGRRGVAGALGMGLAMGIVAAPCVGPLIAGLLIWVGQQADLGAAGLVGGSLSAGLALPYIALAMFSGSLASLPRSGDWMEWWKHAMAFVLFGVALYFLTPLMPDRWFLPAFAALALAGGGWLAFLDPAGRSSHVISFLRGVAVTGAVVAAALLVRLERVEGIEWQPYSEEAVAAAAGRPVMIEFTAAWCVPCQVLEHGAFKDPEVVRESESFGRLRVDLTHPGQPAAEAAVARFGIAGPPVIVFLGADGREIPDLRVREAVGAADLLERMREARGRGAAPATG
jgi:thiol:disulfide interchange protein DsbD